jgi:hypothetical protein
MLRNVSCLIGLLVIVCCGPIAPLAAQGSAGVEPLASTERAAYRQASERRGSEDDIGFVVGNIEYLLVHEIAHFLISEKDVPIIGPIENAADYVATMALLREEPLDPMQRDRAVKFLLATANAFAASWQTGTASGADVPYWGEHALTIQRYYQIACLLYGSDPVAFAAVPRTTGMPAARAENCIAEYMRADRVMDWLLQTYGRQPGDGPGASTEIVYERAPTLVSASVVRELKSIELLDRILARLHERFTLDQPLRLVMRSCGRSQAAWIPDRRELVICYELVDTLYLLGRSKSGLELDGARTER